MSLKALAQGFEHVEAYARGVFSLRVLASRAKCVALG